MQLIDATNLPHFQICDGDHTSMYVSFVIAKTKIAGAVCDYFSASIDTSRWTSGAQFANLGDRSHLKHRHALPLFAQQPKTRSSTPAVGRRAIDKAAARVHRLRPALHDLRAGEEAMPMVVKKDSRREPFDSRQGAERPAQGPATSVRCRGAHRTSRGRDRTQLARLGDKEIPSSQIGDAVLSRLRDIDDVAYLRFALRLSSIQGRGRDHGMKCSASSVEDGGLLKDRFSEADRRSWARPCAWPNKGVARLGRIRWWRPSWSRGGKVMARASTAAPACPTRKSKHWPSLACAHRAPHCT